jgi:4-hydroxyacetophenone monooxygenase
MQAIRQLLVTQTAALEVDQEVFLRYNAKLDEALSHSIWSHDGMTNYFRNKTGRIVVSSPWKYVDFWEMTREFDPRDYHKVDGASEAEELTA